MKGHALGETSLIRLPRRNVVPRKHCTSSPAQDCRAGQFRPIVAKERIGLSYRFEDCSSGAHVRPARPRSTCRRSFVRTPVRNDRPQRRSRTPACEQRYRIQIRGSGAGWGPTGSSSVPRCPATCPPTTALRWLEVLEQRDLVRRHPDPKDRRRAYTALTDDARKRIIEGLQAHLDG